MSSCFLSFLLCVLFYVNLKKNFDERQFRSLVYPHITIDLGTLQTAIYSLSVVLLTI